MNNHDNDDCQHLVRASLLEAENARLKAEIGELKNQPDPLTAYLYAAELAKDEVTRLKAEVERLTNCKSEADRLKAEVERLRKAGDEVVSRIQVCTEDLWCSIHRWNAAKEGKPSV